MRIMTLGDSRTTNGGWQDTLVASLATAIGGVPSPSYRINNTSLDTSVVTLSANAAAYLATNDCALAYPTIILVDLGEHDMVNGSPPSQTVFQNAYLALIDAIVAKWFDADLYLDFPWTVPLDGTSYTNFKGYIQTVISTRSMCHAGVDQGVTIKAGDNGAANTSDGIHFSTAGKTMYAAAMKTAMGY